MSSDAVLRICDPFEHPRRIAADHRRRDEAPQAREGPQLQPGACPAVYVAEDDPPSWSCRASTSTPIPQPSSTTCSTTRPPSASRPRRWCAPSRSTSPSSERSVMSPRVIRDPRSPEFGRLFTDVRHRGFASRRSSATTSRTSATTSLRSCAESPSLRRRDRGKRCSASTSPRAGSSCVCTSSKSRSPTTSATSSLPTCRTSTPARTYA